MLRIAREFGFLRAGIAGVEPFFEEGERLREFCRRGYAGTMSYLDEPGAPSAAPPLRAAPASLFPQARSAVVVALATPRPRSLRLTRPLPAAEPVAVYARGADYHVVVKNRLLELADRIAELVERPLLARACVDTAPVLERDMAARAGLCFTGKNTLSIIPGEGSRFVLGELLLDVELDPAKLRIADGCGDCRACLDICPTQAFVEPRVLDARACISYLTIESSTSVPRFLRPALGGRIFGCDDCQSVCPYNQGKTPTPAAPELEARAPWDKPDADLPALLSITTSAYKRLVGGTALRRINRTQFQRNVAVALGNSPSVESVHALGAFLSQHPSGLAAEHAAWALFQLAHHHRLPAARDAIELLRDLPAIEEEAAHWETRVKET